ncbi:hypothetical protein K492DRAFT_211261 [Lichtheimia hyalospora FSU 10163]|nr:hypothetical protein K492DRAFT_211261 [Lichtheimia hyalospora FSU 10163]
MHWILLYFTTLLLPLISHAADTYSNNGIPNCTHPPGDHVNLNPAASRDQLRFAVIAHYSVLSTFFHSPETAARDAAGIVGVEIEWQRHIVNTGETMAQDIRDAVDRNVDALIVTIPDEAVYRAVQHAMSKNVPVIVFNSGLEYAQKLGLTRVMQDDFEAGHMLMSALYERNYSRPLCLHVSSQHDLDKPIIDLRIQGITSIIGTTPNLTTVQSNDNPDAAIKTIRESLQNNEFDSIIALGGTPTTDLMSEAVFGLDPKKRLGIGFFDIGSANQTEIFRVWPDVFGISQLPYIQAALPVFLMHLRVLTGFDPYDNRTIPTGPTLITKNNAESLASKDGSRFLATPGSDTTVIGTVIPDVQGDTYQSNILAGMTELTRKLGWKLQSSREDGSYGYPESLMRHVKQFADAGVNGIVLQSSDISVLDYARNLSQQHSIPLTALGTFYENPLSGLIDEKTSMVNTISFNMTSLTSSIADKMVEDDLQTPVCFHTHTRVLDDFFCDLLYNTYKEVQTNASLLPSSENFIHSLNLTSSSAMEVEFEAVNSTLRAKNYIPDGLITLSQYLFNVIDYSILRGTMYNNGSDIYIADSLMDQKEAFLNGRVTRVWHLNMYAMGYLSILDILLARASQYRPWRVVPLDTPIVETICPSGTYYYEAANFPFCYDADHSSIVPGIQCLLCDSNTYNDKPNQAECTPCPVGEFSTQGATECTSCNDDPAASDNAYCVAYMLEQRKRARRTYIAVFVPISVVIFLVLVSLCSWYYWRQHKKRKFMRNQGSENVWLLSYDELMRPSMQHLSSVPSPSLHLSGGGPGTSPTIGPLVATPVRWSGSERQFMLPPYQDNNNNTRDQQEQQRNENRDSLNPNDPALLAGWTSSSISNDISEGDTMPVPVKDKLSEDPKDDNQSNRSKDDQDYFTASSPIEHSRQVSILHSWKMPKPLRRIIGFHRNLPVFVKQIGFKRLHVDAVAQHELSLMKVARHPKLVEFIGLCLEPEGTFIVEEYCSKGTLYDVLNNPDIGLTWIFKFSLINDLLEGMEFLHRSKFMFHGCLTSESCFITGRWELKISDYGLSKVRQSQYDPILMHSLGKQFPQLVRAHHHILPNQLPESTRNEDTQPMIIVPHNENLLWLAPESVLCNDDPNVCLTKPSRRADAYSVGIIINEIVSRQQPFKKQLENMSVKDVFARVEKEYLLPEMAPTEADEYTAKVNMIIAECLRRDPTARPSMTTLRNRIKSIDPHLTGANNNVVDNLATLLEQYANDMENLVRQRTANLQQRTLELEEEKARTQNLLEDLKEAKEVAEAAAASKQNFLANMSHEIRTPMNAVIGMSRILMESNLPADLHDCAETIESSGNHLMAIIDDILDYSKIDSGKLNLEHRRLDLTYVVESALKLVSPNFLDKGIILWYTIEGDVATSVYGDVVRLRQVLLNLLSNALKFTSQGHVCVSVKRLAESPESSDAYWYESSDNENSEPGCQFSDGASDVSPMRVETLQVAVTDTGVGIRPEKTDGLFQTFTQVDASTTRNYGGTGLGLAISRRLCQMMGGDMWVESEYGKGSTFYFRVLLREQSSTPTYAIQNRFDDIARLCSYCLVITDCPSQQQCWYHLLTGATIQRVETLSFADAEKLLKHDRPDIIIIDEEYEIVPSVDKIQATSSKIVLDSLRARNPYIVSIPALYVSDARRRDKIETSNTAPALLPTKSLAIDSPRDEHRNPFDDNAATTAVDTTAKTRFIIKPWKNSKLFTVLLDLLEHKNDTESLPVESPSAESSSTTTQLASKALPAPSISAATENTLRIKRRGRSNTTASSISSQSSTSSSVPLLSEIASDIRSLLVDDNPVNQKVVARMLSRLGIKPEVAQNGKEACDKIEASKEKGEPIDLVFMDIWMPEMNGLEAAETIRKNLADSSLHPYIIAMTACVMPGDREKCIAAGMNGYVSKPVRKDELEASIHTYTQIVVKEMHMFESDSDSDVDNRTATPSSPCSPSLLPSVTITSEETNLRE